MIKTGVRYRCDRCGFERFVLDGSMSKAEKDKIAKEWFTVPDADGKEIALCPDCRMVYESRYIEMMEKFIKELATVNEDFPLFASAYEGWAKVRAALAGVETERYMLDRYVEQRLWNEARFGRDVPKEDLKEAQSQAVQMAAQAIRLAAMICKLERSQRRWKRKAGKSA